MDFGLLVEEVRTVFFPRWDKKREWHIAQVDGDDPVLYGGCHGKCDRE
jgi:hypothetical protein